MIKKLLVIAKFSKRSKVAFTYTAFMLLCVFGLVGVAGATDPSSAHYKIGESHFGAGGSLQDCSDNYCSKTSAGDLTVGHGSSANYSAEFGFNTTDQPQLEVIVPTGLQDMGVLQASSTGTAVFTIEIRNYLSNGYELLIVGNPPSQGSHQLDAPTTPTPSQQGQEQFGINLASNTTPHIGAVPVQVPSSAFSFGQATTNYSQANNFMYQSAVPVAESPSSTGQTNYTLSMIANISRVTPAGRYNGSFSAVAVPVF